MAASGGTPAQTPAPESIPIPPVSNPNPAPKVSYDQARIQIRLPDGRALSHTFGAKEPLAAIRLFLEMNAQDLTQDGNYKLMTTFPKKIFTNDDYDKPLDMLGEILKLVMQLVFPNVI